MYNSLNLNDVLTLIFIVITSFSLFIVQHYIFKKFLLKYQLKYWQFYSLKALDRPLKALIVLISTMFIFEFLHDKSQYNLLSSDTFDAIDLIIIISVFTWWMLSFIKRIEKHFLKYNGFSSQNIKVKDKTRQTIILFMKLCFVTVLAISTLMLLHTIGIRMQAIIAFLSLSGVAIGLSSRDLVASFFGTIMIYTSRHFSISDRIRINNIEGVVENITWIATSVRLDNKKIVFIPNIQFLTSAVENISYSLEKRMMLIMTIFHSDLTIIQQTLNDVTYKIKHLNFKYEEQSFTPNISLEILEIEDNKIIIKFKVYLHRYILHSDFIEAKMHITQILNDKFYSNGLRFNIKFED